jgi:hypothetical protein
MIVTARAARPAKHEQAIFPEWSGIFKLLLTKSATTEVAF